MCIYSDFEFKVFIRLGSSDMTITMYLFPPTHFEVFFWKDNYYFKKFLYCMYLYK